MTKIVEKMLVNKIESLNSKLLDTGSYQTGFKKGSMTYINLTKVLESINDARKKRNKRRVYIFVDIKKAYDTV